MDNMIRLKNFTEGVFQNEEDEKDCDLGLKHYDTRQQLFHEHDGIGWTILRAVVKTLFFICHLVVAIVFIAFFVSSIAFTMAVVLDVIFEMMTPHATTQTKKNILSFCFFLLFCSLSILACFMLSLFWQVVKVVLLRTTIKHNIARVAFLCIVLVVSGIWIGIDKGTQKISLSDFLPYITSLSWILAFIFSVIGSILSLVFIYTNPGNNRQFLVRHSVLSLIFLLFAIICAISFGVAASSTSSGMIAFTFFLPFLTSLLIMYSHYRGRTDEDEPQFIFHKRISALFVGFFVISLIIFMSIMNADTRCNSNCSKDVSINATAIKPSLSKNHYQICSEKWTSIELNVAEIAFLANVMYNNAALDGNTTAVQILVNNYFKDRAITWEVIHLTNKSPVFLHLQNKNTNVIAIKGSKSLNEFMESAKLWDEATVIQVLSLFVPLLDQLPTSFLSQYVSKTSFINRIFHGGSNNYFFQEIEHYVAEIKKNTSQEVILAGHSLGGGMAKIIGARKQVSAVSFSSPGIAYGHLKFGFSLEDASKFGVSISPDRDIIPLLDKHVGLQQTISCNGETFVQCHLMVTTFCEIHRGCGLEVIGC